MVSELRHVSRQRAFAGGMAAALAALLAAFSVGPAIADTPPNANGGVDAATDQKVRFLIEQSQKAFQKGELLLAIIQAKSAVHLEPMSAAARAQLGICQMQAGDALNAEDQLRQARYHGAPEALVLPHLFEAMLARGEFEQLVDEFPDPGMPSAGPNAAVILRARALAFQGMDRPADANSSMDRSLAILRDRKGIIVRADIALKQGDLKLARSLSDEVLSANPKDAESLDLRVRVALATHDGPLALSTANELVALTPKSLNSRLTRIEAYLAEDMDDKAGPDVELAAKEFPNLSIIAYYRALLLARAGHMGDAWKTAMMLPHEFNESDPEIGGNVAEMAAQSGHLEPAAAILHATIAKWPHDLDARLELVAIRLKQKNPTDALSVLQPLEDSKDPVVALYFARTYTALHRPNDARKYLDIVKANGGAPITVRMTPGRALELLADWLNTNPADLNARRQYAQLLLQTGEDARAQTQYELVLQAAPNDIPALNNLGWLLRKSDSKRALALVSQAEKLAPNSASVLDTEGWIEYGQNDKSVALTVLQRAHTLRPNSATISCHLAQVLESLGRAAEAKTLLQSALASTSANFEGRADAERLLTEMH
jgi:tetratricopeptide (TPR) repeat protein